jgi:hypothetical protein
MLLSAIFVSLSVLMNAVVLGRLGYRSVALDDGQRTFALKAGEWFR